MLTTAQQLRSLLEQFKRLHGPDAKIHLAPEHCPYCKVITETQEHLQTLKQKGVRINVGLLEPGDVIRSMGVSYLVEELNTKLRAVLIRPLTDDPDYQAILAPLHNGGSLTLSNAVWWEKEE
jgi:hypothetical protein